MSMSGLFPSQAGASVRSRSLSSVESDALTERTSVASEADPDTILAQMCSTEALKAFWNFATTVRRTKSLAARQAQCIRGEWLTNGLAIQRVHSWGSRSVRLLCVVAETDDRRAMLRRFFEKDRRNIDGRLVIPEDPLEREARLLVKVPYDPSLDSWDHERQVLADLADMEGVPKPQRPILFKDIGIRASTYIYEGKKSIQEQLEAGQFVPEEGVHRMASFLLRIMAQAHERGWMHTDLKPADVLLEPSDVSSVFASASPSSKPGRRSFNNGSLPSRRSSADDGDMPDVPPRCPGVVCGWTHAVKVADTSVPTAPGSLLQVVQDMPAVSPAELSRRRRHFFEQRGEKGSSLSTPSDSFDKQASSSSTANQEDQIHVGHTAPPSLYSAPEQFVGLFTGHQADVPSTDVFRVAGVVLMAHKGRGPFGAAGTFGRPVKRAAEADLTVLKKLGQECLTRRAEVENVPPAERDPSRWRATHDERSHFLETLERVLRSTSELSVKASATGNDANGARGTAVSRELVPWFKNCLERDPSLRPNGADEALEALDSCWASLEERHVREAKESQAADNEMQQQKSVAGDERPRVQRIVFEPPPELALMKVL